MLQLVCSLALASCLQPNGEKKNKTVVAAAAAVQSGQKFASWPAASCEPPNANPKPASL